MSSAESGSYRIEPSGIEAGLTTLDFGMPGQIKRLACGSSGYTYWTNRRARTAEALGLWIVVVQVSG